MTKITGMTKMTGVTGINEMTKMTEVTGVNRMTWMIRMARLCNNCEVRLGYRMAGVTGMTGNDMDDWND